MNESATEKSLKRFESNRLSGRKDGDRICLMGVLGAEVEDVALEQKQVDILEDLKTYDTKNSWPMEGWSPTRAKMLCTIGNCAVSVIDDIKTGRTVTGECVASDYCLKEKFEESGDDSKDREERRTLYKAIMDTCSGHADKYSAGNFCPRIDCDLSAGFSIDGHAGTAGECVVEIRRPQQQLDITA